MHEIAPDNPPAPGGFSGNPAPGLSCTVRIACAAYFLIAISRVGRGGGRPRNGGMGNAQPSAQRQHTVRMLGSGRALSRACEVDVVDGRGSHRALACSSARRGNTAHE